MASVHLASSFALPSCRGDCCPFRARSFGGGNDFSAPLRLRAISPAVGHEGTKDTSKSIVYTGGGSPFVLAYRPRALVRRIYSLIHRSLFAKQFAIVLVLYTAGELALGRISRLLG